MLMDLGLAVVEWADAGGGDPRGSVLEEVARVVFESASPVRRFASYGGSGTSRAVLGGDHGVTGGGFESWLERDRLMLLDHDQRVPGPASQPLRVTWQGATRRISHTPAYFARLVLQSDLVRYVVRGSASRRR